MAKYSVGDIQTAAASAASETRKKTTSDPNRAVYSAEDKLLHLVDKASVLWEQATLTSVKSLKAFIKAVDNSTSQLALRETVKRRTPSAANLALNPELQQRYDATLHRGSMAKSWVRINQDAASQNKRLVNLAKSGEQERNRLDSRLNRLRGERARLEEKWMRQDRAGITEPLSMAGRTTPLKPLSRAQLNKIGKVTSPLISDAITNSLELAGNTTVLGKPLSRAQLNKIGKATTPLLQAAVTESLSIAGRTAYIKGRQPARPPTTLFGAGATTPIGGAPTQMYASAGGRGITTYLNGMFPHPAGMLHGGTGSLAPTVPLNPEDEDKGGNWLVATGEALSGIYEAKRVMKHLKKGRDWDLQSMKYAQNLTTDFPTFDIGGAGIHGLKPRSGILGVGGYPDMSTMGPTTVHEVMHLMNNDQMRKAMIRGGEDISDMPRMMASYGVRGSLPEAFTLAATLSRDNDLGYKSMADWLPMLGTLKQRGYGNNQIMDYLETMKGTMQVGGANNLSKEFMETELENARENLASRGNVNLGGMASFMGGIMGTTQLPSLRTPGGMSNAMQGIQGAEMGAVGNPYLFTTMARVIASKGGSLEGAFGDLGPYEPMMKDLKGLPMSQQIAIATQMGAISPDKLVEGITPYFKGLSKNKVLGMQAEMNTLSAGGLDVSTYKDLIEAEFYGSPEEIKKARLKVGDVSMIKPGDADRLLGTRAREGAGLVAAGESALELSKSMVGLSGAENKLASGIATLVSKISNLIDKIPVLVPSSPTVVHSPSHRPK